MGFNRNYRLIKNYGLLLNSESTERIVPGLYKGDSINRVTIPLPNANSGAKNIARTTSAETCRAGYPGNIWHLCFGQGTTLESLEDYTLDSPLTENNSGLVHVYTEQTVEYIAETSSNKITTKTAISVPEGNEAITIKEYGIFIRCSIGSGTTAGTYTDIFTTKQNTNPILIYREVLPESEWVTINPGESREFSFVCADIEAAYRE